MSAGFTINENKGFCITFANGVTVSVQFGGGNYCDNREAFTYQPYTEGQQSDNAEIAIWKDEEWITREFELEGETSDDEVIGFVYPRQVLQALIWAEKYPMGA